MYCELGYMSPGGFRRNIFCETENLSKNFNEIRQKAKNADIYCTIFQSEDKTFSNKIIGPLYFDLDGEIDIIGFEKTKLAAISLYLYLTTDMKLQEHEILI